MSQPHVGIDQAVQTIVGNTSELLRGRDYEIVTEDKRLFPYFTPGLAALKGGQLLVFSISVFPVAGEFEKETGNIQNTFKDSIDRNTPESDSRVQVIERIAVVMAPEDIEGKSLPGDIRWIGLQSHNELADKLRLHLGLR